MLRETIAKLESELSVRKEEHGRMHVDVKERIQENSELKAQLIEREKQMKPFETLNLQDNDTFIKALGVMKWKGEDPAWMKVDFIDRADFDKNDPMALRKEIEHLRLEKGELAAHLEKTQTLLKTHMDIESERERIHNMEKEKIELQLKAALARADELAKLADLRGHSKRDAAAV